MSAAMSASRDCFGIKSGLLLEFGSMRQSMDFDELLT
jgi:hypothetical protein